MSYMILEGKSPNFRLLGVSFTISIFLTKFLTIYLCS